MFYFIDNIDIYYYFFFCGDVVEELGIVRMIGGEVGNVVNVIDWF